MCSTLDGAAGDPQGDLPRQLGRPAAERGGYPHFMLKEICEHPLAVKNTLGSRLTKDGRGVELSEIRPEPAQADPELRILG